MCRVRRRAKFTDNRIFSRVSIWCVKYIRYISPRRSCFRVRVYPYRICGSGFTQKNRTDFLVIAVKWLVYERYVFGCRNLANLFPHLCVPCRHVHGFPRSWFSVSVHGFNLNGLSDSRSCHAEGDVSAANTSCLNFVNFCLQFVQLRKDLSPNISGGRFVRVRKIRCAHAAGHARRGGCPDVSGCHADPHAAHTMQHRHRAGIALKKDLFALPFTASVICKNADFVVVGLPLVIKIKFYIVIAVAAHDAGRVYCACGFVADDDVYSRHKMISFRFMLSVCHWYPHVCPQ